VVDWCLLLLLVLGLLSDLGAGQKKGPSSSTSHQPTPDMSPNTCSAAVLLLLLPGEAAAGVRSCCWRLLRLCLLLLLGLLLEACSSA
jgi:hypothetical protein